MLIFDTRDELLSGKGEFSCLKVHTRHSHKIKFKKSIKSTKFFLFFLFCMNNNEMGLNNVNLLSMMQSALAL